MKKQSVAISCIFIVFFISLFPQLSFPQHTNLSQNLEKSRDAIPLLANKNKKHELGVYSLYKYGKVNGKGWKGDIVPDYVDDPAGSFWETMTAGISSKYAHYTSKCRMNEQVKHQTVFPTDGWKDWDQFDMVFFYGHNNMITPPHPDELGYFWSNNGSDWHEIEGNWTEWGTTALPFEYFHYDITNGPSYPGSVTYLYEPFTAVLLGHQFKKGEYSYYQLSAQNTSEGNTITKRFQSGLGTNDLEWLILHGCQAVIVANENGSEYNPMGAKAFAKTWDGFHIIQGHYKTYTTNNLKELVSFANDLLSGVSIQTAYFNTDPANNTSAISAECKSQNYIGSIEKYLLNDSYMNNDTWTDPMEDIPKGVGSVCGNFFYYVKWIDDDNALKDSTINWYYPIDIKLLIRAKYYILDPGKFPTPELERITPDMAKIILKKNIQKFCNIQVSDREIDEIANIYCVTAGTKTCWVDKSSGAFSISETKGAMSKPSRIEDFKAAVKLALNYINEYQLVTPGKNETIDLIFASNVMNAAVKADEEKPFLSYPSDYIVGFGRRYNGIPVIGSYLNLQIGEDGKLLGIQKNWRKIKGESKKKLNVDSTSIIELTKKNLLKNEIITTEDDFKNIEILGTVCGYFEGSISNTQRKMGLGCLVNYRDSHSESISQLVFPIADFSFSLLGDRKPVKEIKSSARPVVIQDKDDRIEDEDLK